MGGRGGAGRTREERTAGEGSWLAIARPLGEVRPAEVRGGRAGGRAAGPARAAAVGLSGAPRVTRGTAPGRRRGRQALGWPPPPSRSRAAPLPQHPPAGLAAPRGPCAASRGARTLTARSYRPPARRARLCEVAPIVPRGGLASPRLASPAGAPPFPGKGALSARFMSPATVPCVEAGHISGALFSPLRGPAMLDTQPVGRGGHADKFPFVRPYATKRQPPALPSPLQTSFTGGRP